MLHPGFRECEEEKLCFTACCRQKNNLFTSYSRNPERTIKSNPVLVPNCALDTSLSLFAQVCPYLLYIHTDSTCTKFLGLQALLSELLGLPPSEINRNADRMPILRLKSFRLRCDAGLALRRVRR